MDVPGRLIALVGGAVAAGLLATSGLTSLALLGPHTADSLALLQFGLRLATALGGTGFSAFVGLLVAGISVTGPLLPIARFASLVFLIAPAATLRRRGRLSSHPQDRGL